MHFCVASVRMTFTAFAHLISVPYLAVNAVIAVIAGNNVPNVQLFIWRLWAVITLCLKIISIDRHTSRSMLLLNLWFTHHMIDTVLGSCRDLSRTGPGVSQHRVGGGGPHQKCKNIQNDTNIASKLKADELPKHTFLQSLQSTQLRTDSGLFDWMALLINERPVVNHVYNQAKGNNKFCDQREYLHQIKWIIIKTVALVWYWFGWPVRSSDPVIYCSLFHNSDQLLPSFHINC